MYTLCDLRYPGEFAWREAHYRVIVADPPWWYADQRKVRKDGKTPTRGIGACHHYGQMQTREIAALGVPQVMAHPDQCYLFLWATCPLLPDALQVIRAWGFRYSTVAFVWVKTNGRRWEEAQEEARQAALWPPGWGWLESFLASLTVFGPGHHTASNVELVLLGVRGAAPAPAKGCKEEQVIFHPRLEDHSRKPEEMQNRIERMYPFIERGEMCELFARRDRVGWDCYGNEIRFLPYPEEEQREQTP